ncbi:FAD-dependent oxidoreductase [Clostridium botulinum]|nr:FAD-dependent oxidoreductase [Clostridium botulinum]
MKVVVIGGGWAGCAIHLKLMPIKKRTCFGQVRFLFM